MRERMKECDREEGFRDRPLNYMLGDWSRAYSPSKTIEHDTLPDQAWGLVDYSLITLEDSLTTPYAMLEDLSTTPQPQLEVCYPRLHVKFDSHIV
jgi:hypothetical protein